MNITLCTILGIFFSFMSGVFLRSGKFNTLFFVMMIGVFFVLAALGAAKSAI